MLEDYGAGGRTRAVAARCRASEPRVRVQEAAKAVGAAVVYLPPYSADLSPVELAFAGLKRLIRSGAGRIVERLWHRLGLARDAVTPADCRNYFRHCGYATRT